MGDVSRISIHAPQWGATPAFVTTRRTLIFQSTHPSGVRPVNATTLYNTIQFQSTHPSGVRPPDTLQPTTALEISIHAPQWGATVTGGENLRGEHFNPRTPVGCDYINNQRADLAQLFQSTHPSGVRLRRFRPSAPRSPYFNPRTPVGCDFSAPPPSFVDRYFNPRTPVGCDVCNGSRACVHGEFQSTHPSGVRLGYHCSW